MLHRSGQAGTTSDSEDRNEISITCSGVSALLSGRLAFVSSRANARRERRNKVFGEKKTQEFYARRINKVGIGFDGFEWHGD